MTGLELHRHLACSASPILTVLMTAQEDRGGPMQAQALRAGALAFLRKVVWGRRTVCGDRVGVQWQRAGPRVRVAANDGPFCPQNGAG